MTTAEPLSLYLHIPFCSLKCAYCDFNSYAGLDDLIRPYDDALIEEIRLWGRVEEGRRGRKGSGQREVATVFFGGGTPSLLPLAEVDRIMRAVREAFAVRPDAEVSLEANPGTLREPRGDPSMPQGERMEDYLRGLVSLGVNRLSLGVQSFDDDELRALDRIHSAAEAVESYGWARQAGFERVNLDFIYGLPEQSMERWMATLEQAIGLEPDHLSLYALTVEEGTKLAYDVGQGRVPEPDPDAQAEMYERAMERLERAGYRQYEISNWALPGQECRHNLVYWRNGNWLGLGAGAHSHVGNRQLAIGNGECASYRFANVYSPKRYVDLMQKAGGVDVMFPAGELLAAMPQVSHVEPQSEEMEMADTAILGLRLNEGLSLRAFEARFGADLDAVYGPAIAELGEAGLLERENGRLRLTARGRLLANEVFVRLLPD